MPINPAGMWAHLWRDDAADGKGVSVTSTWLPDQERVAAGSIPAERLLHGKPDHGASSMKSLGSKKLRCSDSSGSYVVFWGGAQLTQPR